MLEFKDFNKDIAKKIISKALENGGDFAEIFIEDSKKSIVKWMKTKAEEVLFTGQKGVGIRVIKDGCTGYSFCDGYSENAINLAAKKASEIANIIKGTEQKTKIFSISKDLHGFDQEMKYQKMNRKKAFDKSDFKDKLAIVKRGEEGIISISSEIAMANVWYRDFTRKFKVFNSEGTWAEDDQHLVELYTFAIAQRDDTRIDIYRTKHGDYGLELFDEDVAFKLGQEAGNAAIEFLDAKPSPAGSMPVVIENGKNRGGVLIHEAIGHALEIDFIEKKTSVYTDLLNKKVASDKVSVIDDATLRPRPGAYSYDDEGSKAQRTELIKDGILKGYMSDLKGARLTGFPTSGNGRRENFRYPPLPRMSCTFIDEGNDNPKDIVADIKKGIYVKSLGGGQGDLSGAGFVFNVDEAYMIENGVVTYPIKGASLTGTGLDVLKEYMLYVMI